MCSYLTLWSLACLILVIVSLVTLKGSQLPAAIQMLQSNRDMLFFFFNEIEESFLMINVPEMAPVSMFHLQQFTSLTNSILQLALILKGHYNIIFQNKHASLCDL